MKSPAWSRRRSAPEPNASVSDLMREGVQSLIERDAALDRWLREEVTAGHAAYLAAPSSAITADELRQQLAHDIASSS